KERFVSPNQTNKSSEERPRRTWLRSRGGMADEVKNHLARAPEIPQRKAAPMTATMPEREDDTRTNLLYPGVRPLCSLFLPDRGGEVHRQRRSAAKPGDLIGDAEAAHKYRSMERGARKRVGLPRRSALELGLKGAIREVLLQVPPEGVGW